MKLSSVCEINPTIGKYDDETLVSFVAMPDVSEDGKINTGNIRPYHEVKKGYTSFLEGDVLFAKITPCMENGKGALATGLKNGIGFGSTEFHVLRPIDKQISNKWLYYLTVWPSFRHDAEMHMTGSAGQKRVPKSFFEKYEIDLPSIDQQEKEVTQLEHIKAIIDTRKQQLVFFDTLIKARFVEMFGDDSYPSVPLINLITDGAGLSYGIVQPGDDGTGDMGVLRPVDLVDGKISTDSIKYIDRSIGDGFKKTELNGDELLITVRGTTGITALTDERFKGMNVTRGIAVIRFNRNRIDPVYLNAYLNTEESQRYIQEHTRGATLKQINLSDLRIQQIIVPPMELQKQFAAFAIQIDKSKSVVQKAFDEAQLLFNSLMQEYFG